MQLSDLPAVAGVRHRTISVRGVDLHVAEAGDGPPLVLLHGWPQHWWSWRRMIPALARGHRVIVPDLRGLGWSAAPPGRYDKATLAGDVAALLDAEELESVKLIGHDWGGYTGFLLALAHPERVERFVALDIGPPWGPGPLQPRHLRLPFFMSYQVLLGAPGVGERVLRSRPELVRALIRAASGPEARWTREELDAYAVPLQEPARARASSAYYRTFLTRELPATLRGSGPRPSDLHTPTLQIMGEASPLYRATGAQPGPNLEVRTIPGAGHFLPEEAPDTVLALAGPFLG